MKLGELVKSNYIQKSDVGDGVTVTIRAFEKHNVAKDGETPEERWCMFVDEFEKPLIMNSTNGQLISKFCGGSEDSDDWIGHQVVLYNDETISFGGKITGGIRVRRATPEAKKPTTTTAKPAAAKPKTSIKEQLKARFKSHPGFGTGDLTANNVNNYFRQNFEHTLNELSEEEAQSGMDNFDSIIESLTDNVDPF